MDHQKSLLIDGFAIRPDILDYLKLVGLDEMFPANWLYSSIVSYACTNHPLICEVFMKLMSESDMRANDRTVMQRYYTRNPSGTSMKGLQHYAQLIHSHDFQEYDYGETENIRRYG